MPQRPLKAANVKQLRLILQAGIDAARRKGSRDPSNVKRRIQAAVRRKAAQLYVYEPDLTAKIYKHIRNMAASPMPSDVSAENLTDKEAAEALLQQQSDYAGMKAPELTEEQKLNYMAMEAALPKPITPTGNALAKRDPSKPRGKVKPPVPPKGGHPQVDNPTESERRVHEIVKRLGLGSTRQQIHDWAKANWTTGTSARQIDDYMAAARAVLRTNWQRDREDFMVDLLEQYQRLATDARVNDQLGTALGCLNSMAKLANMGGFANGQAQ